MPSSIVFQNLELEFCLPVLYPRSLNSDVSYLLRSNLLIIFPLLASVFFVFSFRHSQLCILVLKFTPFDIKWYRGIKTTCILEPVDTRFPKWEHYRNHLSLKARTMQQSNSQCTAYTTKRPKKQCSRLANSSIYSYIPLFQTK